jgi:hypothetical protein
MDKIQNQYFLGLEIAYGQYQTRGARRETESNKEKLFIVRKTRYRRNSGEKTS